MSTKSIIDIKCGSRFTVVLTKFGTIYSWGRGDDGQLGHGENSRQSLPNMIESLEGIIITGIACRGSHVLAISNVGKLYSWGKGDEGQLGLGNNKSYCIPKLVVSLRNIPIKMIACGRMHSVVVSHDEFVYTFGCNEDGATGHADTYNAILFPKKIESLCNVKNIACGSRHTLVSVMMDVEVQNEDNNKHKKPFIYSFGSNSYGQLGVGDKTSRYKPTLINFNFNLDDNDSYEISNLECGYRHSFFVLKLKIKSNKERKYEYEYEHEHEHEHDVSTKIKTKTKLYGWGWNQYGQLGYKSELNYVLIPTLVNNGNANRGRRGERDVRDGRGECESLSLSSSISTSTSHDELNNHLIVDIAGGGRHTLAILQRLTDNAKRLYAFGRGDDGQLGTGTLHVTNYEPCRVRLSGFQIQNIAAGWSHSTCSVMYNNSNNKLYYNLHFNETQKQDNKSKTTNQGQINDKNTNENNTKQILMNKRFPSVPFHYLKSDNKNDKSNRKNFFSFIIKLKNLILNDICTFGNFDAGFAQTLNCIILFLLILSSLKSKAGFDNKLIVENIIPGASLTVFISNMYYGIYSTILTNKSLRNLSKPNILYTAIPHGINTVIFFAYTILIIGPVYEKTKNPFLAYKVGLFSCFLLGLLEIPCTFIVEWLRKVIPRAAMMSALAGISLTFISMTFALQIFQTPSIGIMPLILILICYGSNINLPYKVPCGIVALTLGTFLAYVFHLIGIQYDNDFDFDHDNDDLSNFSKNQNENNHHIYFPKLAIHLIFDVFFDSYSWQYITVVLPMLLINIVTNLSCIESAISVGDEYNVKNALLADAFCTIFGAFVGNPFPTCIYIGHPAFKAMGAKTGYNYINAILVLLVGKLNE